MNISEKLDHIILLMQGNSLSIYLSIFSVAAAFVAIGINIFVTHRTHKQYLESIKPLLSFSLFGEGSNEIVLSVKNTGQTEAKNISIKIVSLTNSEGDIFLTDSGIFSESITLYPNESVRDYISGFSGSQSNAPSPVLEIELSFLSGSSNKHVSYSRKICFQNSSKPKNEFATIEKYLKMISLSNNNI